MSAGERKYDKLVLTEFEKTHDLILTAQEEKKLRKIRNKKGYVKILKVSMRSDATRPTNLRQRPAQSNDIEIKNDGKGTGYMPNFQERVTKANPDTQAELQALVAAKEKGRVSDYRDRMYKIRQKVTPNAPDGTAKPATGPAPPSAAAPRPVTDSGQTRPAAPPSDSFKPRSAKSEFHNFSNPYAI